MRASESRFFLLLLLVIFQKTMNVFFLNDFSPRVHAFHDNKGSKRERERKKTHKERNRNSP
jgi:hypothetical protein